MYNSDVLISFLTLSSYVGFFIYYILPFILTIFGFIIIINLFLINKRLKNFEVLFYEIIYNGISTKKD